MWWQGGQSQPVGHVLLLQTSPSWSEPGGVPVRGSDAVLGISGICTQQLWRVWLLSSGCFAGQTEAEATSSHRGLHDRLEAERTSLENHFPPHRLCKAQFCSLFPSLVFKMRWLVGSVPCGPQPCWEGGRAPELTPLPQISALTLQTVTILCVILQICELCCGVWRGAAPVLSLPDAASASASLAGVGTAPEPHRGQGRAVGTDPALG